MSGIIVGLLLGAGVAGWIYAQVMKRTGNNTKQSLIAAALVGFIAFLVTWSVFVMVS